VNPGQGGRCIKQHLVTETWEQFQATYAGAGIEENWEAFFNLVELFRRLVTAVGSELRYEYPTSLDEEVTQNFHSIRNMKSTDTRAPYTLKVYAPRSRNDLVV
jgi:aminoglycoside 6-adenylyltransferase